MAPKVVLTYFPAKARAELVRLILKYGGVEFDDVRITGKDWPAMKDSTPFLSLPLLKWDGQEVGQSVSIARFCAKKVGIQGADDLEEARANALVDQYVDALDSLFPLYFIKPENAQERGDKFFNNKFPQFLKITERHLQKSGSKWVAGGAAMTWADLAVFHLMDSVMDLDKLKDAPGHEMRKDVPSEYPAVAALCDRVRALPAIAKWIKERPQ